MSTPLTMMRPLPFGTVHITPASGLLGLLPAPQEDDAKLLPKMALSHKLPFRCASCCTNDIGGGGGGFGGPGGLALQSFLDGSPQPQPQSHIHPGQTRFVHHESQGPDPAAAAVFVE